MKTFLIIALFLLMALQIILFIHAFLKMCEVNTSDVENIGWMTVILLNGGFFYINTLTWNNITKDVKQ